MAPFEELQNLWQRQPARGPGAAQIAEATAAFRRYGRRTDAIHYGKVVAFSMATFFLVSELRHNPLMLFGVCISIFSALLFLIHDWRTSRAIARLNFTHPSTDFLRSAITRLEAQRDPFHAREFYIAMAGAWVGCNLAVASRWSRLTYTEIIVRHLLMTAVPFAAARLGRTIRERRYRKLCVPLIERLTTMLESMEGSRA